MITTKMYLFSTLFLFLALQNSHAMELTKKSNRKMPALVHDDTAIPITINLENNRQEIVYSSQWNLSQLGYVGNLRSQYEFEPDAPLSLQESHISKKQLKTIEKVTMLLASLEQENKEKQSEEQKNQLKECLQKTNKQINIFVDLLKSSDFLDCPLLFELCLERITQTIKNLIKKNKLQKALLLLENIDNHHVLTYLGNQILHCSPEIRRLLIALTQEQVLHPRENSFLLPYRSNSLVLRSLDHENISFWHDHTMHTISTVSRTPLKASYICPMSNKLFCLFEGAIQLYDLKTGTFLAGKNATPGTKSLSYSPSKNILCFIQNKVIYSYHLNEGKLIHSNHYALTTTNEINGFAFDEDNLIFYLALKDNGILQYTIENGALKQFFSCKSINFTALCLSKDKKTLFSLSKKNNNDSCTVGVLRFWNIEKGTPTKVISLKNYQPNHTYQLLLSPDGTLLSLACDQKKPVTLFDAQSGHMIKIFKQGFYPVAFSQDGKTLATRCAKGVIEHVLTDESLKKHLHNFPAPHLALVYACARILENKNGDIFKKCINISEKTRTLFDELPASIRSYLIGKNRQH